MKKVIEILGVSLVTFGVLSCTPSVEEKTENTESRIEPKKELFLSSWNEGETKTRITKYVEDVTDSQSPNFIEVKDRIATFDNDGNLWSEQPVYFQLFFAIDRIKALAPDHPEWKETQPYKAVLENNMEELISQGEQGLIEIVMTSHTGNTQAEFKREVQDWIKTAIHPTKKIGYDKLVYQPMLELLSYLRAHEFKTYIVSGGGVDFMRAFVTEIYGISEEQILGTRIKTTYDYNDGNPKINRLPAIDFIDDKDGKPLNIQKIIGKKPVFASGNSDGDLQMMQYTSSNKKKNFILYLHHTDAKREWAYDRDSHIGRLDKGLDFAKEFNWTVIDMKKDWKVIYPYQLQD